MNKHNAESKNQMKAHESLRSKHNILVNKFNEIIDDVKEWASNLKDMFEMKQIAEEVRKIWR